MNQLQEEREIILSNENVDSFDFDEVREFVKGADESLFISHHFETKDKMLVQPRGGFPTYEKQFALYEFFVDANVDVLPLTIDSNTRLNDYSTAKKMLKLSEANEIVTVKDSSKKNGAYILIIILLLILSGFLGWKLSKKNKEINAMKYVPYYKDILKELASI